VKRGARRDCYLATKLSCLMLVSDVAWSVLKELREEEYGWAMVTRRKHFAREERDDVCMLAYSRDLDVIRIHGR